jgi:hypothetical protein
VADIDTRLAQPLHPGDVCITGENSYPRFRVIAVHEDRVWVRDIETGKDSVVPAGHCRKLSDGEPTSASDAPPAPEPPRPTRDGAPMPTPAVWPDAGPRA